MGFESFQIVLRAAGVDHERVDAIVRRHPLVEPDPTGGIPLDGHKYYKAEDGRHVFELETSAARVSCRFALSHPPTADAAFAEFVGELMADLGAVAVVPDDPERGEYTADQLPELRAAVARAIVGPRAAWVAMIGPDTLAAGTAEVYEKLILPKCVPAVRSRAAS